MADCVDLKMLKPIGGRLIGTERELLVSILLSNCVVVSGDLVFVGLLRVRGNCITRDFLVDSDPESGTDCRPAVA